MLSKTPCQFHLSIEVIDRQSDTDILYKCIEDTPHKLQNTEPIAIFIPPSGNSHICVGKMAIQAACK